MGWKKKFTPAEVFTILKWHFEDGLTWQQIAKKVIPDGEDASLVYRICLPRGDKKARCKKEREMYFRGMRPLLGGKP